MKLKYLVLLEILVEAENIEHGKEVILNHPPRWEICRVGYSNVLEKQHGGGEWAAGYKISNPKIVKIENK